MTIKDLAKLSGYSLGTVSRVLNHQPNVSEKARTTILELAQTYGFELNTNAKNLKQQRSNSILIIVKGRNNELFAQMVEFIQLYAAKTDYLLLVDYIDEDENEVQRAVRLCREKKPVGILFLGGIRANFLADFSGVDVPAVLVTNSAADLGFANLSSVCIDDAAAGQKAVAHLIQAGHREIAVIGGDLALSEISQQRFIGCQRAFGAHNMTPAAFCATRFSFQGGYSAMEQILRAHAGQVSAVFAMSDVMAIGAIRCIHDWGLSVPKDISVIGFDGLPLGLYCTPKLTTIAQNAEQIARDSVRVLLESVQGSAAQALFIPFSLSAQESVKELT